MKYLIIMFSVLFAITVFNPEVYSQKRMHRNTKDLRIHLKVHLNLTEEQDKKIADLILSHQEAMIKFRSELDLKELEIRKLKSNDNWSRSDMINITKDISEIKNEMAMEKANHQMDIYDNLDENQRKLWAEMSDRIGYMRDRPMHKMRDIRN